VVIHDLASTMLGITSLTTAEFGFNITSLIWSTWEAFIRTGLWVGLLLLFGEYVDAPNRLVRMLAPNAYGVQIIHPFVGFQRGSRCFTLPAPRRYSSPWL